MLNNIADNIEQCGQHNIVQDCFHQLTGSPISGCTCCMMTASEQVQPLIGLPVINPEQVVRFYA